MPPTRTGATKARETAFDLTLLGTACAFGFALLRQFKVELDPMLESTGTAFIMAGGGALARYLRHRRRYRETEVERARR